MGYKTGLDYTAVYHIAETLGIEMTPAILKKIQSIEYEELVKQGDKNEQQ